SGGDVYLAGPDPGRGGEFNQSSPAPRHRRVDVDGQRWNTAAGAMSNRESRNNRDRSGVAIIIVLWVVMVLSLLISGFAFTMHVETQIASYARKELKAEMLARSG